MLLSVHIPKCGGISFQHVLRGIYGQRWLWLNYGTIFDQADARQRAGLVPAGIRCLHGRFLSDAFDEVAPGADLVTWVRHPVERVISLYYHFLRRPDPRDPCCCELWARGLRLEQFAELPLVANQMTRYLAGKPHRAFAFIGVTERFDASLRIFSSVFGVVLRGPAPLANVNPHHAPGSYPVPDRLRARLEALNQADLAVYRDAVERLDGGLAWLDRLAGIRPGTQARVGGSSAFSLSR